MADPESGTGKDPVPAATDVPVAPPAGNITSAAPRDTHPPLSISGRIFATLEHAWFQRVVGMAAVFFGFFDGRYFSIISLMLPLAIHRSKSLRGVRHAKQAVIYLTTFSLLFAVLWAGGKQWNRSRDNSPLIKAIAEAVGVKVSGTIGRLVPSRNATQPVSPSQPLAAPLKPKLPKPDPRLATMKEANELADEIQNIGDDYEAQIMGEITKQLKLEAEQRQAVAAAKSQGLAAPIHDRAADEHPFSELRKNDIRKYEIDRYNSLRGRAIYLRSTMLREIVDIPIEGESTLYDEARYQMPTNAMGLKAVAHNLRALAEAYERHAKTTKTQ
jgi:hypothetical protein